MARRAAKQSGEQGTQAGRCWPAGPPEGGEVVAGGLGRRRVLAPQAHLQRGRHGRTRGKQVMCTVTSRRFLLHLYANRPCALPHDAPLPFSRFLRRCNPPPRPCLLIFPLTESRQACLPTCPPVSHTFTRPYPHLDPPTTASRHHPPPTPIFIQKNAYYICLCVSWARIFL